MVLTAWVVEDDREFAELVANAVATTPDVKVTRLFGSGLEMLQAAPVAEGAAGWLPEFLIVDVYAYERDGDGREGMQQVDGITLAAYMCQIKPDLKVLVISSLDVRQVTESIAQRGFGSWGFIRKTGSLTTSDIAREVTALVSLPR